MSDELTDAEYLELNRLQVLIGQERLAAVVVPVLERLAQAPSVPVHPLVGLYWMRCALKPRNTCMIERPGSRRTDVVRGHNARKVRGHGR
jgi:hypothetical protein